VRLLLLRGERNIRILDITPPSDPPYTSDPAVSYIRTDMTNIQSVRAGLTAPFPSTGRPPRVIFHTAAIIRFWERVSYAWPISYAVNVRGTQNVVSVAANDLPSGTLLVYTSTADVNTPTPHYMRLGLDFSRKPRDTVVVTEDDDRDSGNFELPECNYTKSKAMAECAVFEANGKNGLRTGILRPGWYVILCTTLFQLTCVLKIVR
jgi:nucleoside-diphosphate-sugar epimerase